MKNDEIKALIVEIQRYAENRRGDGNTGARGAYGREIRRGNREGHPVAGD
jgi:ribosomal protein L15